MIPEGWHRDLQSYRDAATRENQKAPRDHAKSAQAQRERHERRMERDRRFWEEMDE